MKYLPQRYNYSTNNAIFSFKQAICYNIYLKFNKITFSFVCQPASLPACQQELTQSLYQYVQPSYIVSETFHQYESLLFRLQYAITCPLFIHSNRLIFLLETKVLTFNHDINRGLTFHTMLYTRCKHITWIAVYSYAQCACTSQEIHMQ